MISVCMASYNGERVILRQIRSIMSQLSDTDELIIVDDGSTDSTIQKVESLGDSRIRIFQNKNNLGPVGSFERGLKISQGDLIFLSDQDDIWRSNKVLTAKRDFSETQCEVWTHDSVVEDANLNKIASSWNRYNHNLFTNHNFGTILKNPFTGSMMALSRKALEMALPFPSKITMHDQWIGMVAQKRKLRIYHSDAILMEYIRYGNNVTAKRKKNYVNMLMARVNMIKSIRNYNK